MPFRDGTRIRADNKAAGAARKEDSVDAAAIVKQLAVCVRPLATKRALPLKSEVELCLASRLHVRLMNATQPWLLLDALPQARHYVVCERGYASNAFARLHGTHAHAPSSP